MSWVTIDLSCDTQNRFMFQIFSLIRGVIFLKDRDVNNQLTLQLVFMNPICSASTFPGTPQSQPENKSKVTNLPLTSLCMNIMLRK